MKFYPDNRYEKIHRVAILLFDDVGALDFCGPLEVFTVTGRRRNTKYFEVFTVSETGMTIQARSALIINPHCRADECGQPDILIIPGGRGTRKQMENRHILEWIKRIVKSTEITLSVCTGSLLLAKAGLLDGLTCTTHHLAYDLLEKTAPRANVVRGSRFIDNGAIITSAGISTGIDASLHVVARLIGLETARETADYMEYPWPWNSNASTRKRIPADA